MCTGDSLGSPPSHSFECINLKSYTGTFNEIKSYLNNKGEYITDSYNGPICNITKSSSNDTINFNYNILENDKLVKKTNSFSCNKNSPDICTKEDPRIEDKNCVLYESTINFIGNIVKSNYYDILTNQPSAGNRGKSYIESYIHYGPKFPVGGYAKTDYKEQFINNSIKIFPTLNDVIENPDLLIKAVEINGLFNSQLKTSIITRFSGLYYTISKDIFKPTMLKAYNEEIGLIDIIEGNRQDIFQEKNGIKIYNGIDPKILNGETYLISGDYEDSFLCEIYYYIKPNNIGISSVESMCFGFRRFLDINSETEYKTILFRENIKDPILKEKLNINWTDSFICNRGEFISQIEISFSSIEPIFKKVTSRILLDLISLVLKSPGTAVGTAATLYGLGSLAMLLLGPLAPIIPFLTALVTGLSFGNFPIITVEIEPQYTGFKGISKITKLNYNVPGRTYNWVKNIDPYFCCHMLADSQYDPESIEYYYCNNYLNYSVKNNFPDDNIPNNKCRIDILDKYCNSNPNNSNDYFHYDKYNEEPFFDTETNKYSLPIDTDMCKSYCNLNDTNCDRGINQYCTSDDLTKTINGIKKPNIMKYLKDPVCGCAFNEDNEDIKYQDSLPKSLNIFLKDKLKFNFANQITDPLRQECTLPSCKKSSYKLFNQKLSLKNKPCNTTEECIGEGYVIPSVNNKQEIDCKKYMGGDFNCIKDSNGNTSPNLSVLPDLMNLKRKDINCAEMFSGDPEVFKFEKEFCQLSNDSWEPSLETPEQINEAVNNCQTMTMKKLDNPLYPDEPIYIPLEENEEVDPSNIVIGEFLKLKREILRQQFPKDDPSLCPPYIKNADGTNMLDKNNNPIPEDLEKWIECPFVIPTFDEDINPKSSNTNIFIIIFIIIIVLIIFFLLKKK